ncbi:MAG: 6-phosphofructokinase [Candidatus Margulisiibacteriota bacterium]
MPGMRSVNTAGSIFQRFKAEGLRIGILHSGGPAPGGNQVLYNAALRAGDHRDLADAADHGVPLIVFRHGFSHLMNNTAEEIANKWSSEVDKEYTRYLRDQRALVPGTARANPGKPIHSIADLQDPNKTGYLTKVLQNLHELRIGALITVGGDDTMTTAGKLQTHLQNLMAAGQRTFQNFMGVIHVPKTIDKDYAGIAFTFGFMSAAEYIGGQMNGMHDDAKASAADDLIVYHIGEIMGRKAGWLTAAAAIDGQATYTIIPEPYRNPDFGMADFSADGKVTMQQLANKVADVVLTRFKQRDKHGNRKSYGTIAIAEGLADLLPKDALAGLGVDEFGHRDLSSAGIGEMLRVAALAELKRRVPEVEVKIKSRNMGYEARQIPANYFDRTLCKRLGFSAVDGIMDGNFGHMVSYEEEFDPVYVPFTQLVDPNTLRVESHVMTPNCGYYTLLRGSEQPFEENVMMVA